MSKNPKDMTIEEIKLELTQEKIDNIRKTRLHEQLHKLT